MWLVEHKMWCRGFVFTCNLQFINWTNKIVWVFSLAFWQLTRIIENRDKICNFWEILKSWFVFLLYFLQICENRRTSSLSFFFFWLFVKCERLIYLLLRRENDEIGRGWMGEKKKKKKNSNVCTCDDVDMK